jgi:hypothetical protein
MKIIPRGNMGAIEITQVELACFWDYFCENINYNIYLKVFKKKSIIYLFKYYYVKVYVKDFKIYVIFKSFEVYS